MKPLTDQIILITGAGRGAGKTLAHALSAKEAAIAAVDISPLLLDELEEAIRAEGGRCGTYVSDMAKKRFVQGTLEEVLEDWGRIDVLINAGHVDPRGNILDLDAWDWQRSLEVNLSGVFYAIQAFGRIAGERVAKEQPDTREGVDAWGRVNAAGVVNLTPSVGNPALTVSVSAVLRLTHEAARELESHNIRVNALCPDGMAAEDLIKNVLQYITPSPKELTGMVASKTGNYLISELLL